jgi:hypothetical protein
MHIQMMLGETDRLTFRRRLNLYKHKLAKAASFLSLMNFDSALYYARSLQHDLRAMHDLLVGGAASVKTYARVWAEDAQLYWMCIGA